MWNTPVSQLAEANIRVNSHRHEEDERRVEQDKPRLSDMRVICVVVRTQRVDGARDAPNKIKHAENAAIMFEYPLSFMMAYTTGTVKLPKTAGRARMPTYGTWFSV